MPKIGHVHLKVSDLKASKKFYTDIFNLNISESAGNYLFLTFGKEHHDLALQEIMETKHPSEDMTGLYHFAFEFESLKQLAEIYFKLKNHNMQFSPVDHGISKAIYFSDPDGNGIECYVDTRKDSKDWNGVSSFLREEEFKKWLKQK